MGGLARHFERGRSSSSTRWRRSPTSPMSYRRTGRRTSPRCTCWATRSCGEPPSSASPL